MSTDGKIYVVVANYHGISAIMTVSDQTTVPAIYLDSAAAELRAAQLREKFLNSTLTRIAVVECYPQ